MSSFFKTMQRSKENTETIVNNPISERYTSTEIPSSYYGEIKTEKVHMDGSYECEEIDVLNFENVNVSFPTDNGEFKLFENFDFIYLLKI